MRSIMEAPPKKSIIKKKTAKGKRTLPDGAELLNFEKSFF